MRISNKQFLKIYVYMFRYQVKISVKLNFQDEFDFIKIFVEFNTFEK